MIGNDEAGVVPGDLVARTRVSEARNQEGHGALVLLGSLFGRLFTDKGRL